VSMIASNSVELDADAARKVIRLLESLEDHDDIQGVSSNMDMSDEVAAELASH